MEPPDSDESSGGGWLLVLLLLFFVAGAAIVIPNLTRPRRQPNRLGCIANLKQLDGAKEQWAIEHGKLNGYRLTASDIQEAIGYLRNSQAPPCYARGVYSLNDIGKLPTCSLGATLGHTL